jgi:hypothetical protein
MEYRTGKYTKDHEGNTAIYQGRNFDILEVDEELQLFKLGVQVNGGEGEPFWTRVENCEYIPF